MTRQPRPKSPFLRPLYRAMLEEAEEDIRFALKVAVLKADNFNRPEITDKIGGTTQDLFDAEARIRRALARLDEKP